MTDELLKLTATASMHAELRIVLELLWRVQSRPTVLTDDDRDKLCQAERLLKGLERDVYYRVKDRIREDRE